MTPRVLIVFAMIHLLCASPGFAQVPAPPSPQVRIIAGVVVESDTRVPIVGASVRAGDAETTTDDGGRFEIPVPAALVEVHVAAAGHFPLSTVLDLRAADALGTELALARDTGFATSVEVVGVSPAPAPGTETVQPAQVLRTPGALDNVFRTLQTMPGVAATEEFGSRLAVRGGAPNQNLTVMDGVEVHDPFRLFGLTSAFNPEIIQRFELATGGFSVKYGDRLSSLLSVENRDGTRDRPFAGSGSLSITDGNIVLEGKLPGSAPGSWLVTGRRTYYDVIAGESHGRGLSWVCRPAGQGGLGAEPGSEANALRFTESTGRRLHD